MNGYFLKKLRGRKNFIIEVPTNERVAIVIAGPSLFPIRAEFDTIRESYHYTFVGSLDKMYNIK